MKNFTSYLKHCLSITLFALLFTALANAQPTYFKGIGTNTNQIPLAAANNATHCQQIYTPTDFNTLPPSGAITKVYMRNTNAGSSATYTNFSISFLQNSLTAFPNTTFLTGFTTALSEASLTINAGAAAGDWFEIPLTTPFPYDNTQTLVYEIKYTNRTGDIATLNTNSVGNKRLSIVAVPGPTTGNLATTWMDFGIEISNPCTGTPVPGSSTATPAVTCVNNSVKLALSGNNIETNLTYTWQSSATIGGTYTDIAVAQNSPVLNITASTTKYYRCAVSCSGGSPVYSTPVLLTVNAQFPGNTYTINNLLPTGGLNFNNFTDAFNAVNCGVSSKTIFNVSAGQVFNENPPELNASGNAVDSIIFQKSGAGANPIITPLTAGTKASSTTIGADGDAILTINGGDYITFDGIDLQANPAHTTGIDAAEYGYYLKKKSGTDACKNVTIKNATITLNKVIYSYGIYVSNNSGTSAAGVSTTGGRSENIKIFNNTITGGYGGIQVRGYAAATPFDLYDQNIEIGVGGANTITDFAGGATTAYGLYAIYQNNIKIGNNNITSVSSGQTTTMYGLYTGTSTNSNIDLYNNTITLTGSGTTAAVYGLYNDGGGTGTSNLVKIYNNTISNFTYNGATTASMYMLYQNATAYKVEIYGNSITNNTHSPNAASSVYALYQGGAVVNEAKIYNNTIADITRASGTSGTIYGLYCTSAATATNFIYGNTISNLNITGTTATTEGISIAGGLVNNVYKNKLTGVTLNSGTTGTVFGLSLASGLTNNVYNNFISDLNNTASSATTDVIRGFSVTSTTASSTHNISNNTILLNANGAGTNFSSSGIFHTTSATATTSKLVLRNNIVVNLSTPNGSGYASAYRRSSTTLTNFDNASNNNVYYVTSGSNHAIFYDGTNADATIQDYKLRVNASGRENASMSENVNFVNGGSVPYDLHINAAIPTQLEASALVIAGITDDIDGNVRSATTPDIGADEFTGIAADLSGPTINYTALPVKSICTDNKIITATITDPSGVNVAAGTKPRLWYKKATENDALPATNTSASNGWKYVEASNAVSPFTFSFNFSLLSSPLIAGDSISYFIAAQDLATTPNVGTNVVTFSNPPASVALASGSFPTSGNINGFSILSLPAITIKSNVSQLCVSGTVKLDIDGVDVSGGEYQWQSSDYNANTWTDLPGATTVPFTTAVITDSTDFRLVVKCGGIAVPASPSNTVSVLVNNPQLLSTTGATRCGTGTVNLQATSSGGNTINWYSAATGGTPIGTGSPFTTPVISTNTNFYAAATVNGGGLTTVGKSAPTANPTSGSGTANFGLVFDALSDFTLQEVTIYPTSATAGVTGTVTIDVINSANTVVHTATVNVTANPTASMVPQTVTLNFNILAGTNYKLRHSARSSGISGLLFDPTANAPAGGYAYPYTIPGIVSINTSTLGAAPGNAANNTLYYYFYNWQVVSGCEGSRVPVLASITAPPTLTTSGSKAICAGATDSLEITSGAASFNTFVWSPSTDLYTNAAATIPYAGGSATKVYVKGSSSSKTGYTVTATNTGTSCVNAITDTIVVLPAPTITATPAEICMTGTSTLALDPTTFYSPNSIQWQSSANGISYNDIIGANGTSYTTPTLTSTTYYKALIKGSNGIACSQPTITVTVNTPTITGTTPGMNCGPGSVVLQATGNSGSTLNWYAASTGGASIGTGSPFNTPSISTTTTYYVSASQGGGGVQSFGPPATASADGYTLEAGLFFNALTPLTISGVYVYPIGTGVGDVVIALKDAAANNIQTITVSLTGTAAASAVKTYVPLNFNVPSGTGYSLVMLSRSGLVSSLKRDIAATTIGGYPFTLAGTISITTGRCCPIASSAAYYYFYDWQISTGCEGARTAVVATIDNTPGCTMPVTLLNFTGEKRGNYNKLLWSTATEINNSGFELQRSTDGVNFSKVIFVNSKAANGNSSSVLTYSFDDVQPLKGNNYYRLKQVDKDGRATITNIVLIKGDKVTAVQLLSVYPNPVKNNINLKVEAPAVQHATLIITDAMGKVIMQQQANLTAGENKLQMPTAALAQGTYFIKVTCAIGCQTAVHKFIKE